MSQISNTLNGLQKILKKPIQREIQYAKMKLNNQCALSNSYLPGPKSIIWGHISSNCHPVGKYGMKT